MSDHLTANPKLTCNESFNPKITLESDVLPTAIKHGMELWWDGSTPTQRLDQRNGSDGFSRYINARIEGKLAEVAFGKMLDIFFDVDSQVDWRIYGDYETTDNGDLQYLENVLGDQFAPAVEFDVKKTKPWNSWLAIREEIYQKIEDDAPVILSKLRIGDDMNFDRWSDTDDWDAVDSSDIFRERLLAFANQEFPLECDFVGAVYPDEFTDEFRQGEKLYDPDTGGTLGGPLRRDNRGIHVSDLHDTAPRWNRVVSDIIGQNNIDWSPLPVLDDR